MSYITEMRTPEQKSRKMLKEERMIIHLEMAIKKEEFRDKQKRELQFREIPVENKGILEPSESVNETNGKISNTLNNFIHKIRF
jgi:hypothetical protein